MGTFDDYRKAELGDERLSKRLARLIEQFSSNPTASISAACRDPYQAKAAYRFVGNDEVTVDAVAKVSCEVTIKNIHESAPGLVLILQDTSDLNYSNLKATEGLGKIAGNEATMGMVVHSALAVGETGEVFGLMAQKLWVRPPEVSDKSEPYRRDGIPIEEKESYKWLEAMDSTGVGFPEVTTAVYVCDREGDIYELFCKAERDGTQYLCRKRHDRKIEEDKNGAKKLDDLIASYAEAGRIAIHVPRDSHTKRAARDTELAIKFGKCKIMRPKKLVSQTEMPEYVETYFVWAEEVTPPAGQEKISWQLVTNVPTASFEDAVTRIQWYTQRWKIEIFHKTLKSGCKVEELQSKSAEKLMKLVAIYSIVALQIMLLNYIARAHPDKSCEICFTEEEWQILYKVANKTKDLPEKPPTIHEAVVMIAKLGGFLARKSDGYPGVTVIWRGLTSFYTILDAVPFLL